MDWKQDGMLEQIVSWIDDSVFLRKPTKLHIFHYDFFIECYRKLCPDSEVVKILDRNTLLENLSCCVAGTNSFPVMCFGLSTKIYFGIWINFDMDYEKMYCNRVCHEHSATKKHNITVTNACVVQ